MSFQFPINKSSTSKAMELAKSDEKNKKQFFGMELNDIILKSLTIEEISNLKEVFDAFDMDQRNYLNFNELYTLIKLIGVSISKEECKRMLLKIDASNSKVIEFEMLLLLIVQIEKDKISKRDALEELTSFFDQISYESKNDKISLSSLTSFCKQIDLNLSQKELIDMMQFADLNGDGLIDKYEFISVFKKSNLI